MEKTENENIDQDENIDELLKMPLRERLIAFTLDPLFGMFFARMAGFWLFLAFAILLMATGYQIAPGHAWLNLNWSISTYYALAGIAGAITGFIAGERRLVAMVCGAIAAVCSLWLIAITYTYLPELLHFRFWMWTGIIAFAIGLIPGVLLYAICDQLLPKPPIDESLVAMTDRCPNPECRSMRGWDGKKCRYCGTAAETDMALDSDDV